MNSTLKKGIQYFTSLGLACLFLYWAFADKDLSQLWDSITNIQLQWVAVITIITLGTLTIRAWRWQVLLKPFAPQVRTADATLALAICYAANVFIPRSGEVLRTISLKWTRKTAISPVLATVVVERIMDFFWLIVFIGLALIIQRESINEAFPSLEIASILVLALSTAALIALLILSVYKERAVRLIRPGLESLFPAQLAARTLNLLNTFIEGLGSLQNPLAYVQIVVSSLLLNTGYVLIIYYTFMSMELSTTYGLGFYAAVVIMAISSLGVVVPTPGGMGSYHIAFALPLQQIYGLPEIEALACATLAHALATLTYLFIGGPALFFQWCKYKRDSTS